MPCLELRPHDVVRRHFSLGRLPECRSQQKRRGLMPLFAVAALALGVSAFAVDARVRAQVALSRHHAETPIGTFVVQIDDKEVESRFKNGELRILDKDGKLKYTLKPAERSKDMLPGTYRIHVVGADGLTVDVDEFTMRRGDNVTVRVKLLPNGTTKTEPPAPEAKSTQHSDGAPRLNWKIEATVKSNCLAFSNDGAEIFRAYYTPPHRVYIDSAKDGSSVTPLKPLIQAAHITSIRVGPDDFLALTMSSHKVTIQDRLKHGVHATMGVEKTIEAVAIAKQRLAYLVPDAPDEIGVHSLRDGKMIESYKLPQATPIGCIDCSPDGKTVVALSTDGELFAKIAAAPTCKSIFKAAASSSRKVKLSPDLDHTAVAINEKLYVLETATGKEFRKLTGHEGNVVEVLFTPDGRYLLSLSKDKTFRTWDIAAGKQLHRLDLASPGIAMAISPDGRSVALATEDDSLRSYKLTFPEDAVAAKKEAGPTRGAPALLKAPFTKEQGEKARAEWAKFLNIPERKDLDFGKSVKLGLVLIPPGEFLMGDKKNARRVTIRRPFYAAATETTQEQFAAVMGSNPSAFSSTGKWKGTVTGLDTAKFPVERVAWDEALEFAAKINAQVPTEAQWEYACRAGTTTDYNFGDWLNGTQANCDGTKPYGIVTAGPNLQRTTTVASYAPNAFGLYDMHGNVREWCYPFDVTSTALPDSETPVKPILNNPIYRGGSWHIDAHTCRSTFRMGYEPTARLPYTGFRVIVPVLDQSKPEK